MGRSAAGCSRRSTPVSRPSAAASRAPTSSAEACRTRCSSSCSRSAGSEQCSSPDEGKAKTSAGWEMTTQETIDLASRVLMPNYRRWPVAFVEGQGVRLWDTDGREYLDFVAGIAVDVLGHCHPSHVRAIQQQATRLIHVSNLYQIPQQAELGRLLVDLTGISHGRV